MTKTGFNLTSCCSDDMAVFRIEQLIREFANKKPIILHIERQSEEHLKAIKVVAERASVKVHHVTDDKEADLARLRLQGRNVGVVILEAEFTRGLDI